jgi:hypothetical protein
MRPFTVILDSCVLFPARLRSLLLYLGRTELFWARWTADIHEEWIRAFLETYPDKTRADADRIRELVDAAGLDPLVSGYSAIAQSLVLPDPNDRHVVAAAIVGDADAIVTFNLADFPDAVLRGYDLEAIHPDDFLVCQFDLSPDRFLDAVRLDRSSLRNPPLSPAEYITALDRSQLPNTAALLREHPDAI